MARRAALVLLGLMAAHATACSYDFPDPDAAVATTGADAPQPGVGDDVPTADQQEPASPARVRPQHRFCAAGGTVRGGRFVGSGCFSGAGTMAAAAAEADTRAGSSEISER